MSERIEFVICPNCGATVTKIRYCNECGSSLEKAKPVDRKNKTQKALSDEGLTLLAEVCRKTLATIGGDGYEEIVLYEDEKNKQYYIHRYARYVFDKEESHASYVASEELKNRIFDYIEKNRLATWKNNKGVPLCGGDFVLKFRYKDEVIRLDSEKMMDNLNAYGEIQEMLLSEMTKENRRYSK